MPDIEGVAVDVLRTAGGAVEVAREFVLVEGPEAVPFLQGQVSQDVAGLAVGASAWSLLLQPQGKVDALVRVLRWTDQAFVVDVDAGWGAAVQARIERFKLRTKADVSPLPWRCLAVRGPGAHEAAAAAVAAVPDGAVVAVVADWPGLAGVDLVGPHPDVPAGMALVHPSDYEAARIEAGWPAMGAELTSETIPAEAGIVDRTVSFTKGCYTGQELVARIDSRGGNVPRHLRGLVGPEPLVVGAALTRGGDAVGFVTSAATSPTLGHIGLGIVRRSVEPPATLDGDLEVRALPLVG